MIENSALGVRSARCSLARIDALVPQTRLIRAAVLVGTTTERAHVVQADVTQEAIVVQAAGQQAIAADAFLVQCTLVINGATRQANVLAASMASDAVFAFQTGHWYCEWKSFISMNERISSYECLDNKCRNGRTHVLRTPLQSYR